MLNIYLSTVIVSLLSQLGFTVYDISRIKKGDWSGNLDMCFIYLFMKNVCGKKNSIFLLAFVHSMIIMIASLIPLFNIGFNVYDFYVILDGKMQRKKGQQNRERVQKGQNNIQVKEEKADAKASSMLDFICLNKNLNTNQKKIILQKLKKVYLHENIYNMGPINYALDCDEEKAKTYKKEKK